MPGTRRKNVAVWDARRNSSAARPVPPNALSEARAALERFRRDDPALYRWIQDGAPRLTEREHLERFGEPYKPVRPRKRGQG